MPARRKRATKFRKRRTSKSSGKRGRTNSGLAINHLRSQLGATESFPVNVASDSPFGARALAAEIRHVLGRMQSPEENVIHPGHKECLAAYNHRRTEFL